MAQLTRRAMFEVAAAGRSCGPAHDVAVNTPIASSLLRPQQLVADATVTLDRGVWLRDGKIVGGSD